MSQHLENFAKEHISGRSEGYLLALWIIYTKRLERGRLSEKIKEVLANKRLDILKLNISKRARKYLAFAEGAGEFQFVPQQGLKSLGAMRVSNFRGFGSFGSHDKGTYIKFSPGKNIFYAPNGGGKTSLCEAIEYVVTGSLKEADRRSTKLSEYIRREDTKHNLVFRASDGSLFESNALWSPCFIDRNRLQEFSLLGSKDTNFQQKDVLAALFGLEEIEELIQRFVLPKSFNLAAFRVEDSTQEKARLALDFDREHSLKNGLLQEHLCLREDLCRTLGISHYDTLLLQNRLDFSKKLLAYRERKLRERQSQLIPNTLEPKKLSALIRSLRMQLFKYSTAQARLADNIGLVNFQDFFNLLVRLGEAPENLSSCPACLTPIEHAKENPYFRAQSELVKLEAISGLKDALHTAERGIVRCEQIWGALIQGTVENEGRGVSIDLHVKGVEEKLEAIKKSPAEKFSVRARKLEELYQWLLLMEQKFELYNQVAIKEKSIRQESNSEISEAQNKIDALRDSLLKVKNIVSRIKNNREQLKLVRKNIQAIGVKQRSIRKGVAAERRYNELLAEMQQEYEVLYQDLLKYKLSIEEVQVQGVEETAAEYYRKINKHDDDSERIEQLRFERATTGYRIKITTPNGASKDAFSALSEGHIRSLGLSLLLAVAEKYKYPFIVFDDVVNAIDSDHRANIIDLMFNDPYLKNTQQIITTHDRLFWERYCNMCKIKHKSETFSSRVLKHTNKGIVVMDYDAGFSAKVEQALSVSDIRQALIYCRIWLETMVVKFCVSNKIKLTGVFAPNNLRPENLLEISLEQMYKLVIPATLWDSSNIDVIKKDLINWKGQNQEHHAFDEHSFNFVHSKTSPEIQGIYQSIKRLEYQLFPADFKAALDSERELLSNRLAQANKKLADQGFVEHAKPESVEEFRLRKLECESGLGRIEQDLLYVEKCVENRYVFPELIAD
ncbi:AAA family ATPase [Pseudomonas cichorii]|nr:AAA family ATPase [Pseudomonas cichorii]MBX8541315.1 AAA family ATPase [Pseudomonas cichorii]MBX8558814.1 AAA family ATPase [Pseudomonas cichorii]MBX8581193.1 AAA family ATPase [Pseudomonas cichorii]